MTDLNNIALDAQELHKKHPNTFWAPSEKDLKDIQIGNNVKVCVSEERFWVFVEKVDGDTIEGKVNNDLINTFKHGLSDGDDVKFSKRHVYQIY